jgi:hypothetical protein
MRASLLLVLVTTASLLAEPAAHAQVLTVTPSVSVGGAYDDNVFWVPVPATDLLWRVTPGLSLTYETPRSSWFGTYSFDAERYRAHPFLTTPHARQNGSMIARLWPASETTITMAGGYDTTMVPFELNGSTGLGLGLGRPDAWRWYGSPEVKRQLTAATAIDAIYQLSREGVTLGESVTTNAIEVTLSHQVTGRDELRIKGISRQFFFASHDAVMSQGALVGLKQRLTPLVTWSVDVGPRFTSGSVEPEIEASLVRRGSATDLMVSYDRTQTTAIGVVGLVDVQRAVATIDHRLPNQMNATVQAGAYSNSVGVSDIKVYRASLSLSKYLGRNVSVSMGYGLDVQFGFLGIVAPIMTTFADLAPVARSPSLQDNGWLHRNVVLFRLVIAPQARLRSRTPEEPGQPGSLGKSPPPVPQGSTPLDRSDR